MNKKNVVTKVLASVGTALVWFPILVPILFSALRLVRARMFRFDYLLPAELFPVILVGGGLLLWAAVRANSRRWLIGGSLGVAIALLVLGQALAILTGLASGETEPEGWRLALVLASIVGYSLAVVGTGVGGLLLLGNLFNLSKATAKEESAC